VQFTATVPEKLVSLEVTWLPQTLDIDRIGPAFDLLLGRGAFKGTTTDEYYVDEDEELSKDISEDLELQIDDGNNLERSADWDCLTD